ncbi:response regulator [Endozoicomonas euniceicola]|uniref:histidine kinase n=1 Tax=Endozoicomonas euniceicola TaxID=1234143 RepID=A0ABY6GV07_9GAMM|nr:response regulator [Endozoicomonas euniceicola]UYM16530.1 response regulator [Endozoicomonas euniceicola]
MTPYSKNNTTQAVKQRILLMALLPGIIISLVMGSLYLWTRFSELEHLLLEKAQSNSARLATFIDIALTDGDMDQVQELSSLALEDSDVRAVSLQDEYGNKIVHAGPRLSATEDLKKFPTLQTLVSGDESLLVTSPLYSNLNIIGWLRVEYSYATTNLEKYRSLAFSALLVLLGLGAGAIFCLKLGRSILYPLEQMMNHLAIISSGKIHQRLNTTPTSLLHDLESSINTLLDSIEEASDAMRKSVDQTTEELQETLETIEIQNVELDLARKEALKASRSKSEFLANMSHEIRTPLNGIIGYTSLMLEGELKPQQREYLTTIEKSAQGLMSLLNDILDFSRLEAGKLELDNSRLNLHSVIDDVLSIMAPAACHKSLELVSFIYNDTPDDIMGDRQRLSQILINLVSNAIKFTNNGSVAVRVMLEHKDDNGLITLKFTVTDTGTGMTPEQHSRLFQAFSQADSSRSRKAGGAGLGLAISKSLVEQMQGEIGLDSDLGRGSSFWFTIRSYATDNRAVKKAPTTKKRSVLLYEPQELSRLAITHQLERLNCVVAPLRQRQDVTRQLKSNQFDLIIISQEDRSLTTVLTEAAELSENTPVVVLTTTSTTYEHPDVLPDKVSTLSKPVGQQRLLVALTDIDAGRRFRRSFNSQNPPQTKQSILVVDDNPVNVKLLKTMLSNMGQSVKTASSGFEAIKLCQSTLFDLILMDVQMPGMDGIETTRQIRSMEHTGSSLPIIAVTAHALPDEKKLILQNGLNDYMTKPVNARQLTSMVSRWTSQPVQNNPILRENHFTDNQVTSRNGPVDRERSIQLAGGNTALADEMLDMLVKGLDNDLETLQRHARHHYHKGLLDRVHRLHGSCRYCGVPELEEGCYQLESLLKQDESIDMSEIQTQLKHLFSAIQRLQHWYQENSENKNMESYSHLQKVDCRPV